MIIIAFLTFFGSVNLSVGGSKAKPLYTCYNEIEYFEVAEMAIAIKLVKKSAFQADVFENVDTRAKRVIDSASPDQILALTITRDSPLRVADARIFTREVFESILSGR